MNLYIWTGLSVLAASALFALMIARLTFRARSQDFGADSLHEFSTEAYRPMERLLNEGDHRFLAGHPGFQPAIGRELRSERVKIFRMYLREMVGDFNSLIRIAKLMLVYGAEDRPEFAVTISRLQYEFYWNVLLTELQLTLFPLVRVRTSASNLIGLLDRVRESVQESKGLSSLTSVRAL